MFMYVCFWLYIDPCLYAKSTLATLWLSSWSSLSISDSSLRNSPKTRGSIFLAKRYNNFQSPTWHWLPISSNWAKLRSKVLKNQSILQKSGQLLAANLLRKWVWSYSTWTSNRLLSGMEWSWRWCGRWQRSWSGHWGQPARTRETRRFSHWWYWWEERRERHGSLWCRKGHTCGRNIWWPWNGRFFSISLTQSWTPGAGL